jgi:hypothetical protein
MSLKMTSSDKMLKCARCSWSACCNGDNNNGDDDDDDDEVDVVDDRDVVAIASSRPILEKDFRCSWPCCWSLLLLLLLLLSSP